jgi:nitrite reductase/ring-hydroxylating ferredoxin subunit
MAWVSLCEIAELTEDQGKYVQMDGHELAVFLHGGKPYVLDNTCPHAGGPLWEGSIENGCCVCPWHSWSFRLENGQLRDAPGIKITTYPTRVFERAGQSPLLQADLPIP